ncbi:hypothetical protein H4R20_005891, partial [Coemansia guatemalensis]
MGKQKRIMRKEIAAAEAKLGPGKTVSKSMAKAIWRAKTQEAKQKRKEARHTKALNAAKVQEAYRRKEVTGEEVSLEEFPELDTKQHKLRVEKAKGKLHSVIRHSRITLRGMVNLEKQSLARKIRRAEKTLQDLKKAKNTNAAEAEQKKMLSESMIAKFQEDRKFLDEVNIEDLLECFMYKLKRVNPTLRNVLDITPLTPELEKLSKNEVI